MKYPKTFLILVFSIGVVLILAYLSSHDISPVETGAAEGKLQSLAKHVKQAPSPDILQSNINPPLVLRPDSFASASSVTSPLLGTNTVPGKQADKVFQLISENKPAISDVRGNLGPATCITNETMSDWLTDRWQAAKNMKGEPIPGEHWVEIDLLGLHVVQSLVIDWEVAHSNSWTVQVRKTRDEEFSTLCTSRHIASTRQPDKLHVVQTVAVPEHKRQMPVRYVRLVIHKPATRYGASIWRLQVWGSAVE